MYVCLFVYMCVCVCACVNACTCVCVFMYAYMYVCMHLSYSIRPRHFIFLAAIVRNAMRVFYYYSKLRKMSPPVVLYVAPS